MELPHVIVLPQDTEWAELNDEYDSKSFIESVWDNIFAIQPGDRILMSADISDFQEQNGEIKEDFIHDLQVEFIGGNLPHDIYVTIRFDEINNPDYLGVDIYRRPS